MRDRELDHDVPGAALTHREFPSGYVHTALRLNTTELLENSSLHWAANSLIQTLAQKWNEANCRSQQAWRFLQTVAFREGADQKSPEIIFRFAAISAVQATIALSTIWHRDCYTPS
jgi:hypothetical protein